MRSQKQKRHKKRSKGRVTLPNQTPVADVVESVSSKVVDEPAAYSFSNSEEGMLRYIRKDVVFAVVVALLILAGLVYVGSQFGNEGWVSQFADRVSTLFGLSQ